METNQKPNYKKFTNEQDKPFFSGYLNTAKQNVFIIFRDISERLGLGFDLSNDDNIMNADLWEYLKNNKRPEITQHIIEKLMYHFPFASHLTTNYAYYKRKENQAEPLDYYEIFELLIKQLYEYRNFYTHVVHDPVIMNKVIINGMRILFDAARIEVKDRFNLKTEDVNHLVRLGPKGKENKNFYYNFSDDERNVSEKGLAFFICLGLQRKDAQIFLKSLVGFKLSESPSQKATLEVYTNYSPRIPQPRLTSDNSIEGLLLDMVNELKRCPKELYHLLSIEDREKFKAVKEDNTYDDNDEYEAMPVLKRSRNRFFYFALRYLDNNLQNIKFHIDLGNYCFHVYEQEIEEIVRKRRWIKRMTSFGNLEDFADKMRPAYWVEKTLKLEDKKVDNPNIYITDTTPHYHINGQNIGIKFINNYVALRKNNKIWPELPDFGDNNKTNKPRNETPDCWLSLYELPSIVFYHLLKQQNIGLPSVERIINDHRNQIRGFFNDLENNRIVPSFTDTTLKAELKNRGLKKSQIPSAIVKYLTSKPVMSFEAKASKRLSELVTETSEKLDKIKRQEQHYLKKPGSKDYIDMKCGHLADFLARDMISLQKPYNNMDGKANSTEFQILQSKLAYFGKNKDSLSKTFHLFNLMGSQNIHPFLYKIDINQCIGILDFYKKYLDHRYIYFKQCLNEKRYSEYHFLKLGGKSKEQGRDYFVKLANTLQKETVMNLPRGLFLESIIRILKANDNSRPFAIEIEKMERVNAAYVIDQYLGRILNDKPQVFYSYNKSYEFLNKLFDSRKISEKRNALPEVYFDTGELAKKTTISVKGQKDNEITRSLTKTVEQHIKRNRIFDEKEKTKVYDQYMARYNDFTENEKQIRLAKTCDEVMFMMIDDIFRKYFVLDNGTLKKKTIEAIPFIQLGDDYKLGSIKPDSEKGFLSLQTTVKLQMPFTYETNTDKVLKVKGAESKLSARYIKTIVRETIKIKNYGDFRAFLKDRRISSLLPYLSDREIHYEALQKELELFQKARMEVFDRIFRFEKDITGAFHIPKNKNGYIYHTEILKQKINEGDERFGFIKELRNAFNHSNYPAYVLFKDFIDGSQFNELRNYKSGDTEVENKSVILQFKNLLIQYYDELTDL